MVRTLDCESGWPSSNLGVSTMILIVCYEYVNVIDGCGENSPTKVVADIKWFTTREKAEKYIKKYPGDRWQIVEPDDV